MLDLTGNHNVMIVPVCADITDLRVDAVVNAANCGLRGGGGVDGAIHRAAGPRLAQACRAIGGCPTGEARVTPAFDMPCRWIIHTAGPVWHGGSRGEEELLRSCYRNCFALALERAVRSIAFPAVSTGVYGYPRDAAAVVAVFEMRRFERGFDVIIAVGYGEAEARRYRRLLSGR